ncbi:MAG: hypothetical protein R3362_03190 [Rhodothermales bacterium]|nr:hypothetical protein [Rhodothermales bacterium]
MQRIKSALASLSLILLITAAPLALSACNADSLAGPDQATQYAGNEDGGGNDADTNPDGDILD